MFVVLGGLVELAEEDVGVAQVGVGSPLRASVTELGRNFQTLLRYMDVFVLTKNRSARSTL